MHLLGFYVISKIPYLFHSGQSERIAAAAFIEQPHVLVLHFALTSWGGRVASAEAVFDCVFVCSSVYFMFISPTHPSIHPVIFPSIQSTRLLNKNYTPGWALGPSSDLVRHCVPSA